MNNQINSDHIQKSREQKLSNMTYQKNELEQLADYIRSQVISILFHSRQR